MSLSDLASLGGFVSGNAVLVSLVFLYFQETEGREPSGKREHSRVLHAHDIPPEPPRLRPKFRAQSSDSCSTAACGGSVAWEVNTRGGSSEWT